MTKSADTKQAYPDVIKLKIDTDRPLTFEAALRRYRALKAVLSFHEAGKKSDQAYAALIDLEKDACNISPKTISDAVSGLDFLLEMTRGQLEDQVDKDFVNNLRRGLVGLSTKYSCYEQTKERLADLASHTAQSAALIKAG